MPAGQIPRQRCIYFLAVISVVLWCGMTVCGIGIGYIDLRHPAVWLGPFGLLSTSLGVAALRSKTSYRKTMLKWFFVLTIIFTVISMFFTYALLLAFSNKEKEYDQEWNMTSCRNGTLNFEDLDDYPDYSNEEVDICCYLWAIFSDIWTALVATYGVIGFISALLLCGHLCWCTTCCGDRYVSKEDEDNEDGQQSITLPKEAIKGSEARIMLFENEGKQSRSVNEYINKPPEYAKLLYHE